MGSKSNQLRGCLRSAIQQVQGTCRQERQCDLVLIALRLKLLQPSQRFVGRSMTQQAF